jgi:hypothetical protein
MRRFGGLSGSAPIQRRGGTFYPFTGLTTETGHKKGKKMANLSAMLILSLALLSAVIAVPYFSSAAASQEIAFPKGDRLDSAACADQTWPNLSPSCLRGGAQRVSVRTVGLSIR